MTLRPQTISVAVLLVAFGLIFILVGNAGVSTGVFLPEPTLTPIPPTATPLPDPSEAHWTESPPGQVTYSGNPERTAQITYQTMALDIFIQQRQLEAPAEGTSLPLLDLLQQRAELYSTQIEELQLQTEPNAVEGPIVEKFGGVPVALLRVKVPPQALPDGREFPGLDLVEGLIERGEDEVAYIEYALTGEPDLVVYNDFRAWLNANAPRLAGLEEEGDEAAEPSATEAATEEPAPETPAPEATEEPAPEATAEPTEEVTAEPAPETTEEATAEPASEATEEAAAPVRGWTEIAPGQLVHPNSTSAAIAHLGSTVETLAAQLGIETPAQDAEQPLIDLLTAAEDDLKAQLVELGGAFAEGSVEGPEMRTYGDVPVAYFHAGIDAIAAPSGQSFPAQELALVIIDQGEGYVRLIQMQYVYEGEADPSIYADFQTWLEENAAQLLTLIESAESPAEPEATAEPES